MHHPRRILLPMISYGNQQEAAVIPSCMVCKLGWESDVDLAPRIILMILGLALSAIPVFVGDISS